MEMELRMRWMSTGARALLCLGLLAAAVPRTAMGNTEGDSLYALRQSLIDPYQVLQSWSNDTVNPCTWFHVTCNADNSVIRVDLGSAFLSGSLVPELGVLKNLQYFEMYNNSISGPIPAVFGNLTELVSLDLYTNDLTGAIPSSLGNLKNLLYLRINENHLSGPIPQSLTRLDKLRQLNVSDNDLSGVVPLGIFTKFGPGSFAGNPDLIYPELAPTPSPAPAPESGN